VNDIIIGRDNKQRENSSISKKEIFISQKEKYVPDVLKETSWDVSINQNHKIESDESSFVEKSQYQILIGKLICLLYTSPSFACVVSVVIQFMHDLRERYIKTTSKILWYLKSSPRNC